MEKIIKYVRYFDYLGAIASLAYGLLHLSILWIGFGVAGLVFAWWSPARRLNALVERQLISKRKGASRNEPVDIDSPNSSKGLPEKVQASPDYGYRTDLPYPRGVKVFRFQGADNFQRYALYIGDRFGQKHL